MANQTQSNTVLTNTQTGLIALFCIFVCIPAANTALSFYACFVLLAILKCLWFRFQPAVFLFGMLFQWAQSSLRIFQANIAGEHMAVFDGSNNADTAAYTALSSTLIVTLILAKFIKDNKWDSLHILSQLSTVLIKKVFWAHVAIFFIMPLLAFAKVGGLSQIIVSLESVKWMVFTILAMSVFLQKNHYSLLFLSFSGELIMGFTGYFSGFKTVVFFSIIALLSVTPRITFGRFLVTGVMTALVLGLSLFWTGIKGDYRNFLSGGRRAQIVTVSATESLEYIYSSISTASQIPVSNTIDALLNRVQYTKMIQYVMDYVPRHLDYQQGGLWREAVLHILQPRIFFPDKPPLDDSAITIKYTGMRWAGAQEGTSISIGYIAESYVDYGIPRMFIPIAILTLLIGLLYRSLVHQNTKYALLFYATSIILFSKFSHIETSYTKVLGGVLTTYLVYMLIIRTIIFPIFWTFITPNGQRH